MKKRNHPLPTQTTNQGSRSYWLRQPMNNNVPDYFPPFLDACFDQFSAGVFGRFDSFDKNSAAKFEQLDAGFAEHFGAFRTQFEQFETGFTRRFDVLNRKCEAKLEQLSASFGKRFDELTDALTYTRSEFEALVKAQVKDCRDSTTQLVNIETRRNRQKLGHRVANLGFALGGFIALCFFAFNAGAFAFVASAAKAFFASFFG